MPKNEHNNTNKDMAIKQFVFHRLGQIASI